MTALVLLLLAGLVVGWLARQAGVTDARDETDRFARLQRLAAGWAEPRSQHREQDSVGSRSGND